MKTKSLLCFVATIAFSSTSYSQVPAQAPTSNAQVAPQVLFSATPEKPYTITSVGTTEVAEVRVTNHAARTMEFAMRLANLENVDAATDDPRVAAVMSVKSGETVVAKRVRPDNSTLPMAFDYSFDFDLQREQASFDVSKDANKRKVSPIPPQSEWAKLPNFLDVAARGELEPYAWYMAPNGRPMQSVKYEAKAKDAGLGRESAEARSKAFATAMKAGQNPIDYMQKQQLADRRAFDRERLNSAKVRRKDAAGNMVERAATGAEQAEQLRRLGRGSRLLTAEERAAEMDRANEQIARGR